MKNFPDIPGYRIKRELGAGGMARIYLAYDEKLERDVALKVLLRKFIEDEEVTKRFLREAKTAARLQHTNIVTIYDVGRVGDFYYFSMEYLEESLLERQQQPGGALRVIKQIAAALAYAHNQGFIHRDIKPENILFRQDGTPVLVDFGIARAVDAATRITKTGVVVGTPYYMSPEQIAGRDLDGRADIYSLGVVLFELLAGKLAYESTDVISVSLMHLREPIPKLPKSLSRYQPLINRMMAKDRERRIQDAEELIVLIDAYIKGSEQEYMRSRYRAAGRKAGRSRASRAWLIPVMFLLVGFLGYYVYRELGMREQAPQEIEAAKEKEQPAKAADRRAPVRQKKEQKEDAAPEEKPEEPKTTGQPVKKAEISTETAPQQKSDHETRESESPPFIRTTPAHVEKVHKNEKGFWQALFFNDTPMVYIPAGEFSMGRDDAAPDQRPVHPLYLDGFWIGKHEVTFAQYDRFSKAKNKKQPKDRGWGRGRRPVIYVSWRDAEDYCAWLTQETGLNFCLPSESQWEKAARGPADPLYPWGDAHPGGDKANDKGSEDGAAYSAEVGSYPAGASHYGLLDMAGNVREWCRDWYDADYYAISPAREPAGPLRGRARVVRGGSWRSGKRYLRCSHRQKSSPSNRDPGTGFRIVCLGPTPPD